MVAHTKTLFVSDHPVCGAKVGFAEIFFMPQPPLLTRRGVPLAHLVAASPRSIRQRKHMDCVVAFWIDACDAGARENACRDGA